MIFLNLCFIISNFQKNNKNSLYRKASKKRKKRKYKKPKYKSKLNIILFTIIIIFFFTFLTLLTIGIYRNNYFDFIFKRKPKIVAISYSNEIYQRQLQLNKKSAIEVGEVDEYYSYGPDDLDPAFREKNKHILSRKRGNGYWLWKPYIIYKTMIEKLKYGDYLIYTDACVLYMNSTRLLVNFLKKYKAKMWTHRLDSKEYVWTKRDAFILMDADTPFYTQTGQYYGTYQIFQKAPSTIKLVKEWLYYGQDARIITDDSNTLGKPNYPGFMENRHDQTIISLLIKKYGEANSGSPKMSLNYLNKLNPNIMPRIFCTYRREPFRDYEDIRNICKLKYGFK